AVVLLPEHPWLEKELQKGQRWLALDSRLAKLARSREKPISCAEAVEFAELCRQPFRKRYALALHLYREVFADDPQCERVYQLQAAGAALQRAAGQSGWGEVGSAEAVALRHEALLWLRGGLKVIKTWALSDDPAVRSKAKVELAFCQRHPDLASVRSA